MPASSRFRSNRFRLLVTFGFFLGGFYEIIASTHVYQISQSGNNPVIYSNLPKTNNKNKKPINYFKMPVIEAAMKYQLPSSLMRSVPMNIWDDVSNASCYSSSNEDSTADFEGTRSWEQRLPFVIVIGAQKGGSSALAKYLYEHPSIAPSSKELHFLAYQIDHQLNGTVRYSDYVQRMKKALKMKLEEFQANQNLHFLDATPNYMFFSDRVPQRLLCLCPWAKLLVVLRNPVDRAMSQYSMQFHKLKRSKQANYSFAEWIRHDYQVLTGLGVLRNHSSHEEFERFSGSQEEMDGWKVYTKLGLNSPIGRGLYSLQLSHWFKAFAEQNKTMDLCAIKSEDMLADTNSSYARVLKHLHLPQIHLKTYRSIHRGKYKHVDPMTNATRKFLEGIFEPYNRQLVDILGEEWRDAWRQ